MRFSFASCLGVVSFTLLCGSSAVFAQSPNFLRVPTAQEANARAATVPPPSPQTSPAPTTLLPWQQATPQLGNPMEGAPAAFGMPRITPPGQQAMPAALPTRNAPTALPSAVPFGQPIANQYQPVPLGPHTATAVPVESVESIEATEPAPAEPAAAIADPASEDPAEPTEFTAPIFAQSPEEAKANPPQQAVLQVLNKVTARAESFVLPPNTKLESGNLHIWVSHCQHSLPDSLPDSAALFRISEIVPNQSLPKPIFYGWLYASSPSVNALEHPIYDVTLLGCRPLKNAVPAKKK